MGVFGSLDRDGVGVGVPAGGPLFPEPPIHYRGAQSISIEYETDTDGARSFVPDFLELVEPATVTMAVTHFVESTLGSFHELQCAIHVRYEGTERLYYPLMYVTEDVPLALGRELLGTPKKLGSVTLVREPAAFVAHVERPRGISLLTMMVAPRRRISPGSLSRPMGPPLLLRVLSHPDGCDTPQTVQLVQSNSVFTVHDQWEGVPGLGFPVMSELDPLYRLPVRRFKQALYTVADITSPRTQLVREW